VEHVPAKSAQAFFVAAIRETFEESGILLARRRGQEDLLGVGQIEELSEYRLDLQSGNLRFREIVERFDLELSADRLAVHAHWITPELAPRRFDTVFFTALAPHGQLAQHDGVETTDHTWIRPEDALEQMTTRQRRIILPTAMNLRTLCGFGRADEALEASRLRPVVPVLPALVERDGKRILVIPEEAGYPICEAPVEEGPVPHR
jgi:8-oxo-dGTP pyrophosphatase MutT (NUDIX family)